MSDKPDVERWVWSTGMGALIGLTSGLLTGPAMLIWQFIYSSSKAGSSSIFEPLIGGIISTNSGLVIGGVAGALVGLCGIRLTGPRRCISFGPILMAVIATAWVILGYRLAIAPALTTATISMYVVCPILAGIASGALIGHLTR
jgi:hypothetical protein